MAENLFKISLCNCVVNPPARVSTNSILWDPIIHRHFVFVTLFVSAEINRIETLMPPFLLNIGVGRFRIFWGGGGKV